MAASARLADEFAIVERYLEIQRTRHADRLAVSLTLAPEAAHASVPVLVVQPLVENALKHGLTPRVQAGTLAVRASVRDGRIRIDVEDDGVGLPEGWTMAASRGTGLRNLASRLAAEFGDQAALAVSARQAAACTPRSPSVRAGMTNRAWRVVIVDDEPLARQTLRMLLTREADFLLAGESTHAKDAIEAIGDCAARRRLPRRPHAGARRLRSGAHLDTGRRRSSCS